MSEKTHIAWATSTANPWTGCRRVSEGCRNCYMFTWKERMGKKGTDRERTKGIWKDALVWNRKAEGATERPRVFPSLCDWLDHEAPIEWLADFLKLIRDTPNLLWLLLTKRPEDFESQLLTALGNDMRTGGHRGMDWQDWISGWTRGKAPANIWIGVSVEDQQRADERIPLLLKIPARVRFLSVEPLLSSVDLLRPYCHVCKNSGRADSIAGASPCHECDGGNPFEGGSIHWLVVGGESGPGRRDCGVEAICDVARQCQRAGVPIFVKQDCALRPGQQGRIPPEIWQLKDFPDCQ